MKDYEIGTCVRFVYDYEEHFVRFDIHKLRLALGTVQRVASYDAHGPRYEVLWRWKGNETSVSFHGAFELKRAGPLEALAAAAE